MGEDEVAYTEPPAQTLEKLGSMPSPPGHVTQLLVAWDHGDRNALDNLIWKRKSTPGSAHTTAQRATWKCRQ
jgi:hypothetical protein